MKVINTEFVGKAIRWEPYMLYKWLSLACVSLHLKRNGYSLEFIFVTHYIFPVN